MMRLKDKVAIVTGGGKGIGKAIALAFAAVRGERIINVVKGRAAATGIYSSRSSRSQRKRS